MCNVYFIEYVLTECVYFEGTWNQAQEAAKKQAKQEDTVSSEPDHGRGNRTKFRNKRFLESSESESDIDSPAPPPKKGKKSDGKIKTAPSANLSVSPSLDKIMNLLHSRKQSKVKIKNVKPGVSRFTGLYFFFF